MAVQNAEVIFEGAEEIVCVEGEGEGVRFGDGVEATLIACQKAEHADSMLSADHFIPVLAAADADTPVDHHMDALDALAGPMEHRVAGERVFLGQQRQGGEIRWRDVAEAADPLEVERSLERADELQTTGQGLPPTW